MKRRLLLAAIAFPVVAIVTSQDNPSVASFVESARKATAKYQDQAAAVADGYRQIGSDFPSMGEHWIHIGLLFDGKFDPAHPEVLMYAMASGRPQLLGVAYALPLLKDESPPDWPVPKEAWHDHFRTLEDETELPLHHLHGQAGDTPRIAMLHAWIWFANPAGMFAADNWAIPYFRVGMQPPEAPEAAAKALALVSGGAEYFSHCVTAAVPLNPTEREKVNSEFARSRKVAETILQPHRSRLTASDLEQLSACWHKLWVEIDSSVSLKSRARLQQLPVR